MYRIILFLGFAFLECFVQAADTGSVETKLSPYSLNKLLDERSVIPANSIDGTIVKGEEEGNIQIFLTPPAAVDAGAQWRRVGTTLWLNSGDIETNVPEGQQSIEFKELTNYIAPEILIITVPPNGTVQATASYTPLSTEVEWSSYLGDSGNDSACGIALDSDGNCYITGYTGSSGWVSGGWDTTFASTFDGYVAKLNPAGQHLWSTYLGGTSNDFGYDIAVDSSGNCYVTGATNSSGWISGGGQPIPGGQSDAYLVKLNAAGEHQWSTYLGGENNENGYGIAVDAAGNCYVAGSTHSSTWISGGWISTLGGERDGFLVKINAAGQREWSTYLGGIQLDDADDIAVDAQGNCYVTGVTYSEGWVSGGWKTAYGGYGDGFVVKFNAAGAHQWSTYLGGADMDDGDYITVDAVGNSYASGKTSSAGWIHGGWQTTFGGGYRDGFVVKLNATGAHQWSTYLGGSGDDYSSGLTLDPNGNCYVTGTTESPGWVIGSGNKCVKENTKDVRSIDAFLVDLNAAGRHLWSYYLGGLDTDLGLAITLDEEKNIYAVGNTSSPGWVFNGWRTTYGGNGDGFVAKILNPLVPPEYPQATDIGTDTITWTWIDRSINETGFKIYEDPGASDPVTLQTTTTANVQLWQHNGLTPNTQYAFQVAATNTYMDSAKTDTITAWTLAAQPLIPLVTNATVHSLDVALTSGDGNPAGTEYAIRVDAGLGGNVWVQTGGSLGAAPVYQTIPAWNTITITGLNADTLYGVFAIARNGEGVDSATGLAGYGQTLEDTPLTGSILINSGAEYTNVLTVNLTLAASAGSGSNVADMQFSNDTLTWSGWEPFAPAKTWNLISGDGIKTVYVQFRNTEGTLSEGSISDSIILDTAAPSGTIQINGGEDFTNTATVALTLSADDGTGSGVASMQFSNDSLIWSEWEPYVSSKEWNLSSGDGLKTVYAHFRDNVGNISSTAISDTITLDTLPPICNVLINNGNNGTHFHEVTLTLNSDDGTGAGVADMQFSNDNVTWSFWESYTPAKAWTLSPEYGSKTVFAAFRDNAGNTSSSCSDHIVLVSVEPTCNPQNASEGDSVSIRFSVIDTLRESPIVTVNEHLAEHISAKDSAEYLYHYTVLDNIQDPIGPAQIQISCTDINGHLGIFINSTALTIIDESVPPQITEDPQDRDIYYGQDTTFSVIVSPSEAITFAWQKDGVPLSNNTTFTGVDTNVLTIHHGSNDEEGGYRCVVSNMDGSTTSNTARLTVADPYIIEQPHNLSVGELQTAEFTVVAVGSGALHYEWFLAPNIPLNDIEGKRSGTHTASLQILNATRADEGYYFVKVTGADGTLISTSARLRASNPVIVIDPQSQVVPAGSTVYFSVVAEGALPIFYQWRKNSIGITDGGKYHGATTPQLRIDNVDDSDEGQYSVVVVGINTVHSNSAILTVVNPPVINQVTLSPENGFVPVNGSASLTVVMASGDQPFTYQWYKDDLPLNDDAHLSGSNAARLSITSALAADTGFYTVIVSNDIGNAASIPVHVRAGLQIICDLRDRTVKTETHVECAIAVAGGSGGINFQWMKENAKSKALIPLIDGNGISGVNTDTLVFDPIGFEDSGYYAVEVSDDFSTILSRIALITVVEELPLGSLAMFLLFVSSMAAIGACNIKKHKNPKRLNTP